MAAISEVMRSKKDGGRSYWSEESDYESAEKTLRTRREHGGEIRGEQKDKIGSEVQILFIIYYSLILLNNAILIIINYGFNCLYHPLACGEFCPRLTRFSTPGASSHISENRALG